MRDRAAERALAGRLRVDVDPLMVARRLGEEVDLPLVDPVPRARAEVELVPANGGPARVIARDVGPPSWSR